MERIVADPHPAVRAAVFKCCLAVLETKPAEAIAWALRGAEGHEALLATAYFNEFLLFACRRHPDEMAPTLRRMLESPLAEGVRVGAIHTVGLYLEQGRMEEAARGCVSGSTPQRVGAAEVAAALAGNREYAAAARSMLLDLLDDEEDEVLRTCGEAFHDTSLDLFAGDLNFLEAYASSRAFQRHPFMLLYRLQEHPGSLVPFASCTLRVAESLSLAARAGEASRQATYLEANHQVPGILLRLYEQAQEERVRELCLDAWDLLLQARVVAAVDLTKKIAAE